MFPRKFGVKKEPLDGAGRHRAALGAPWGLPRECGELLARHCGMTHVKSLRAGNGDAIVLIFWVPFGFSERDASEQKPLLGRIREYPEPEGTHEDQKSHIQYILFFFFFFSYSFP